ncbi:MAG: SPOR domain-containing protein [Pararhodobacter sp.]|nr:SPOR domain-containing protein [Pararhodobacter sp.]
MSALRCAVGGSWLCAGKLEFLKELHAPVLGLVLGLVLLDHGAASAQSAQGPAEMPPIGFDAEQYVDSRGCAFGRVQINGQIRWVPRLRADRTPLCDQTPSLATSRPAGTPEVAPPAVAATTETARAPAEPAARSARQPAASQPTQRTARATHPRSPAAAPVMTDAAVLSHHEADIPTVPCPRRYRGRDIVCLEREVYERLQAGLGARAVPPGQRAMPEGAIHSSQTGGRYVQVGTFAVPTNAQNTVARLQARGLPVARGDLRHRGRAMQVVLAGPFDSPAAVREALGQARAMGFSDAFIR